MKQEEAAHEPGAEATATTPQTCTICGYEIAPALGEEPTAPTDAAEGSLPDAPDPSVEDEFPWWIVIVIVAAVAGAIIVVIIQKKKR